MANGQLYWKQLEVWSTLTADRGQNGTHSLSFTSFSQIPPQLWGAFRCQLEGFSPLGWDRKRSLTKKKKQANLWLQATGVWLRWGLQLNQTIRVSAAWQSSAGMRLSFVSDLWEIRDHFFFLVYVQPPLALWPCQLFPRDRKKKKKISFMFVGKLRLAETRL